MRPVRGRGDDERLVEERGRGERRVAGLKRKDDEGEVELALREQPNEVSAAALFDEDVDAWILGAEASERGGQQHGRQARRGAQPQPPSGETDELLHLHAGARRHRPGSASRAGAASRRPAVSVTLPRARLNSGAPSSRSSRRICLLKDGCATWTDSAARVK